MSHIFMQGVINTNIYKFPCDLLFQNIKKYQVSDAPRLAPVFMPFVAAYSYGCLHRFHSGHNSFGRRTVQFALSASRTSLSDVWLAARCFHPCMPAKYVLPEIWIATGFYAVYDCDPLYNWPLSDKRPNPQIFDESRCAIRESDLSCLQ